MRIFVLATNTYLKNQITHKSTPLHSPHSQYTKLKCISAWLYIYYFSLSFRFYSAHFDVNSEMYFYFLRMSVHPSSFCWGCRGPDIPSIKRPPRCFLSTELVLFLPQFLPPSPFPEPWRSLKESEKKHLITKPFRPFRDSNPPLIGISYELTGWSFLMDFDKFFLFQKKFNLTLTDSLADSIFTFQWLKKNFFFHYLPEQQTFI